jgi:hypothetical protein
MSQMIVLFKTNAYIVHILDVDAPSRIAEKVIVQISWDFVSTLAEYVECDPVS